MTKRKTFWLATSPFLAFYLAWPPMPFVFLLFVAFVPFFITYSKLPSRHWILAVFVALFCWNTLSTYWIYYTLPVGAFFTHLFNAVIFTIPFIVFLITARRFSKVIAYINFVLLWISLEYLQLNWELAFPFLNLGNGIAVYPSIFQWYEYSGALGGSVWVLVVNVLISEIVVEVISNKTANIKLVSIAIIFVATPITLSAICLYGYVENSERIHVAIINPAINCYDEKYTKDLDWLLDKYLTQTGAVKKASFILWPETAIPNAGLLNDLNQNPYLNKVRDKVASGTTMITGAIVYKRQGLNPRPIENKTFSSSLNEYLSVYNCVIEIENRRSIEIVRSKKKLVPFEEAIPYPFLLTWIRSKIGSLGGFTFSYLDEGVGFARHERIKATPLICYEVLFGDMVSFLSMQSNVFFLLLNEGWYDNETASLQFLYYTSLRAVETRRAIARSSNMGISAIINQRGVITNRIEDIHKPAVLEGVLSTNDSSTIYAITGDIIGEIAAIAFVTLNALLIIGGRFNLIHRLKILTQRN